jgi:DeoR/GlpR family transcriptional regulator of sugar metabolism
LTIDGKLTDNSIAENQISKAMMECSKKSVLLLNSQKIGEPQLNTLCSINDVDFVISEKSLSEYFPKYTEKFI